VVRHLVGATNASVHVVNLGCEHKDGAYQHVEHPLFLWQVSRLKGLTTVGSRSFESGRFLYHDQMFVR
jgi:hypothetical protein